MGDSKTLFWGHELDALADGTGMIVPKRGKDLVSCVVTIDFKGTGIKDPGDWGRKDRAFSCIVKKASSSLIKGCQWLRLKMSASGEIIPRASRSFERRVWYSMAAYSLSRIVVGR